MVCFFLSVCSASKFFWPRCNRHQESQQFATDSAPATVAFRQWDWAWRRAPQSAFRPSAQRVASPAPVGKAHATGLSWTPVPRDAAAAVSGIAWLFLASTGDPRVAAAVADRHVAENQILAVHSVTNAPDNIPKMHQNHAHQRTHHHLFLPIPILLISWAQIVAQCFTFQHFSFLFFFFGKCSIQPIYLQNCRKKTNFKGFGFLKPFLFVVKVQKS